MLSQFSKHFIMHTFVILIYFSFCLSIKYFKAWSERLELQRLKFSTIDSKRFSVTRNSVQTLNWFFAYLINFVSILHDKPEAGSALPTRSAGF